MSIAPDHSKIGQAGRADADQVLTENFGNGATPGLLRAGAGAAYFITEEVPISSLAYRTGTAKERV